MIHRLVTTWNKTNLMKRIAIGIVLGVILALIFPKATGIGLLGQFFVGGLRAINILTLAAANTLHIQVDFGTALILSVVAAISACGASGVAGGSLLLIPVACSLFGITNDLAMQVVSVGFIIGVIQDSCETALNSSTDVLFTAIAEMSSWPKEKRY